MNSMRAIALIFWLSAVGGGQSKPCMVFSSNEQFPFIANQGGFDTGIVLTTRTKQIFKTTTFTGPASAPVVEKHPVGSLRVYRKQGVKLPTGFVGGCDEHLPKDLQGKFHCGSNKDLVVTVANDKGLARYVVSQKKFDVLRIGECFP